MITSVEPLRISYCRELIMRLMVKVKKVWDLSVFFLTNVVLNGGDIISDGLTAYALCKQYFLGAKILFLESQSDSPIGTSCVYRRYFL